MPTTRVRPRARLTARELGTYPSSSMTRRTLAAVASSSSPRPLSTRETVVLLTPACAATSAMVMGTGPPPRGTNTPEPLPKPVPAQNKHPPSLPVNPPQRHEPVTAATASGPVAASGQGLGPCVQVGEVVVGKGAREEVDVATQVRVGVAESGVARIGVEVGPVD